MLTKIDYNSFKYSNILQSTFINYLHEFIKDWLLYSEFTTRILPPVEGNDKGHKLNTHSIVKINDNECSKTDSVENNIIST